MTVNVFGGGTWGIAFSNYLTSINIKVDLYCRSLDTIKQIQINKTYPKFSNFKAPDEINFINSINDMNLDHLNILAVPTKSIPSIMKQIHRKDSRYLILSKGFHPKLKLLSYEIINQKFNIDMKNIAVLSGPNHAEEVVNLKPTAAVVTSTDLSLSEKIQKYLSSVNFRIYLSDDLVGVQVLSSVKNIIAIASGICEGLDLGDNAQAALITRGLNEMKELKSVYDFKLSTLYGMAGLGDLLCTCYSNFSRNKNIGLALAQNKSLDEACKNIDMVAEGVHSSKVVYDIINEFNLEMPICREVYNIIYLNASPELSIKKLMNRELKKEQ
jgi:glycerol-3-phosphate dehydrogenase (NAD(P)+)